MKYAPIFIKGDIGMKYEYIRSFGVGVMLENDSTGETSVK